MKMLIAGVIGTAVIFIGGVFLSDWMGMDRHMCYVMGLTYAACFIVSAAVTALLDRLVP